VAAVNADDGHGRWAYAMVRKAADIAGILQVASLD
jgi:hypothetical protein